jgi:hypothetical protein
MDMRLEIDVNACVIEDIFKPWDKSLSVDSTVRVALQVWPVPITFVMPSVKWFSPVHRAVQWMMGHNN